MSISPARALALGVVSVIALAGSFAAGTLVGDTRAVTTTEYVRAADGPPAPAREVACPAPPASTAMRAERDRFVLCELEVAAEMLLLQRGAAFADVDADYVDNRALLGAERRLTLSIRVASPSPWSNQEAIDELASKLRVDPVDIDMLHEQSDLRDTASSVPPRGDQR